MFFFYIYQMSNWCCFGYLHSYFALYLIMETMLCMAWRVLHICWNLYFCVEVSQQIMFLRYIVKSVAFAVSHRVKSFYPKYLLNLQFINIVNLFRGMRGDLGRWKNSGIEIIPTYTTLSKWPPASCPERIKFTIRPEDRTSVCGSWMGNAMFLARKRQLAVDHKKLLFIMSGRWWPLQGKILGIVRLCPLSVWPLVNVRLYSLYIWWCNRHWLHTVS